MAVAPGHRQKALAGTHDAETCCLKPLSGEASLLRAKLGNPRAES